MEFTARSLALQTGTINEKKLAVKAFVTWKSGHNASLPQQLGEFQIQRVEIAATHIAQHQGFAIRRQTVAYAPRAGQQKSGYLPTSSGTEFGASTLVVIANGIPSKPVGIIVEQ